MLRLVPAFPLVAAGTSTWTAALLILRLRRMVPGVLAVAPMLVGGIGLLLLTELGVADAEPFAQAWILAPVLVVAAAFAVERIGAGGAWLLVAGGLSAQCWGIVDGGPAITARLPIVGDALTADLARLALVVTTAVVAGSAAHRITVREAMTAPHLVALASCWVGSALLSVAASDLGQAFVTVVLAAVLLHVITFRWQLTVVVVLAMGLALVSAMAVLPHARDRVEQFTTLGASAELDQGKLALFAASSGGLFGVGPGHGHLSAIGSTTARDWLLAADARVFGFLGVLAVLGALGAAGSACLRLAAAADSGRHRVAATAVGVWTLLQVVIASAGVFGVVPETGLAPPFFGAGRVPVLVFAAAIGLAATAAQRKPIPSRRTA